MPIGAEVSALRFRLFVPDAYDFMRQLGQAAINWIASLTVVGALLAAGCADSPTSDEPANIPPTADVRVRVPTSQQWSDSIETVPFGVIELDGSTSVDEDGSVDGYSWTFVASPPGSVVRLDDSTSSQITQTFPNVGSYRVELVVTDDEGAPSSGDTAAVVTRPAADIYIELVWSTEADSDPADAVGTDLNLHLLHPSGTWNTAPYDAYWDNPEPDWGASGPSDDPQLIVDALSGAGPEPIRFSGLESETTYRVGVLYRSADGFGPSTATVRIFVAGEFTASFSRLLEEGQFWEVASIEGGTLAVQEIDQLYVDGFP